MSISKLPRVDTGKLVERVGLTVHGKCKIHGCTTYLCSGKDCDDCIVRGICSDKIMCGGCHIDFLKAKDLGFRRWYYDAGFEKGNQLRRKKKELESILRLAETPGANKISVEKQEQVEIEIVQLTDEINQKLRQYGRI